MEPEQQVNAPAREGTAESKKYFRGSLLLLFGRMISICLNLAAQVVMVRYLSRADYGAFAFGLTAINLLSAFLLLGYNDAVSRFTPMYLNDKDYSRVYGLICLAVGSILGVGIAAVLLIYAFQGFITGALNLSPLTIGLLLILIFLAPVEALDRLLVALFAVFAGAKGVFFRRHLLGPGLKLLAVLLVVTCRWDVYQLAATYLAAGLVGIGLYLGLLIHVLKKQGLWAYLKLSAVRLPAGRITRFSLPMMGSELALVGRGSLVVLFLETFHTAVAVAAYRAVVPVAMLNKIVSKNFGFLYIPTASKWYGRKEYDKIDDLYWKTAVWIAVLTFPLFLFTFVFSESLVCFLFGEKYAGSGPILSLLALGYFFHAALGFKKHTLKVFGCVKYIMATDAMAILVVVGAGWFLVPRYGALGGAGAVCGANIVHNLLNQLGLKLVTTVRPFNFQYLRIYGWIAGSTIGVGAVEWFWAPNWGIKSLLWGTACVGVLTATRTVLNSRQTFPELLKIPGIRRIAALLG
jgi:O-antigen/teichoic acid export membrane protein